MPGGCCHAITLGRRHPELCQCNVLGDTLLASLCPSQPAVQAYLQALIRDVADRYPFGASSWSPAVHDEVAGNSTREERTAVRSSGAVLARALWSVGVKTRARNGGVDVQPDSRDSQNSLQRLAETVNRWSSHSRCSLPSIQRSAAIIAPRPRTLLDTLRACCGAGGLVQARLFSRGTIHFRAPSVRHSRGSQSPDRIVYAPPAVNLRSLEKRSEIDGVAPIVFTRQPDCLRAKLPWTQQPQRESGRVCAPWCRPFSFYNYGALRLAHWIGCAGRSMPARAHLDCQ